jgi:hypothetical protein
MATISSNKLAVYALNVATTSPLEIYTSTDGTLGNLPNGNTDGEYGFALSNTGVFLGFVKYTASGTTWAEVATSEYGIIAAATSTSLEATNTINEVAARNGNGTSTNFIASGSMSWNVSVEGLLEINNDSGSAVTLMDAARSKQYVFVKFDTDGPDASSVSYVGQALLGSISMSGGVDDIATYSATINGYGDLYKQLAD